MKTIIKILLVILIFPIVIFSQTDSVNVIKTQNINFGDISGQLLAGSVGGGLIMLAGAGIGVGLASINNTDSEALGYGIIGMIIGYTIGNALGVYIAANKGKYEVNFLHLFLSSSVSMGIGLWLNNARGQTGFLAAAPLFLPPILTVLALNVFNKKENLDVGVGLHKIPNTNKQNLALQLKYSF